MAIKAWILASLVINDKITNCSDSYWSRQDLMIIPDALKYSRTILNNSETLLFENNIGVTIMLFPYGDFDSKDLLDSDFYSEDSNNKYTQSHNNAFSLLKNIYPEITARDFDWVMPVIEGTNKIDLNYCEVDCINYESKFLAALIDCSMIYSSAKAISDFMHFICNKTELSKFQRWQLAYYQRYIQTVEKPLVYLTNKEEILLYEKYYSVWGITDTINGILNNASQTINLISFLSNYENNVDNDLFSGFLTFFGIIVGLEAIYNLLTALFVTIGNMFRIVFIIAIFIIVFIYAGIFGKKAVKRIKENYEYNKKTSVPRKIRSKNK